MSTQNDRVKILFPVARYVTGNMYEVVTKKDNNGNDRLYAAGHKKAGQPMLECYFGIAIPKAPGQAHWAIKPAGWDQANPGVPYWGEQIWTVANAAFPKLCENAQRHIILPTFAWKIEDGDDTTPKGEKQVRNCDKPGHPGHWIVHLKTPGKVPKIYNADASQLLLEPDAVKRGYYVEVYGDVQGNGQAAKPGIYINHEFVAYRAPGDEIRTGTNVKTVGFGRGALPAGVSAVPTGNAVSFPGAPGLPAAGALPQAGQPAAGVALPGAPAGLPAGAPVLPGAMGMPGAGAPAGQTVPQGFPVMPNGTAPAAQTFPSSQPVAPQPGFLQPPAMALPTVAQQPVAPVLAPAVAAQGHTWASLQAAGVTLEQAKAQGWVL